MDFIKIDKIKDISKYNKKKKTNIKKNKFIIPTGYPARQTISNRPPKKIKK